MLKLAMGLSLVSTSAFAGIISTGTISSVSPLVTQEFQKPAAELKFSGAATKFNIWDENRTIVLRSENNGSSATDYCAGARGDRMNKPLILHGQLNGKPVTISIPANGNVFASDGCDSNGHAFGVQIDIGGTPTDHGLRIDVGTSRAGELAVIQEFKRDRILARENLNKLAQEISSGQYAAARATSKAQIYYVMPEVARFKALTDSMPFNEQPLDIDSTEIKETLKGSGIDTSNMSRPEFLAAAQSFFSKFVDKEEILYSNHFFAVLEHNKFPDDAITSVLREAAQTYVQGVVAKERSGQKISFGPEELLGDVVGYLGGYMKSPEWKAYVHASILDPLIAEYRSQANPDRELLVAIRSVSGKIDEQFEN